MMDWMTGWMWWVSAVVMLVLLAVGLVVYFRSFRRWRQAPPDPSPEAQQAEMNLQAESYITDRF